MRPIRRHLLAPLAALALLVGACGDDDDTAVEADGTPIAELTPDAAVAQAASVTRSAGSSLVEFTMTMTMPGVGEVEMTGDGAYDYETGDARMTMSFGDLFEQIGEMSGESMPFEIGDMEFRTVDGVAYAKFGLFEMLAGSEWVRFPVEDFSSSGMSPVPGGDPSALLDVLGGGDGIEEVGSEDVRGVATTHFRGTFDPTAAADQVPEDHREQYEAALDEFGDVDIPIDVWLDADGLIRRYSMALSGSAFAPAGDPAADGEMVFVMEFFDYGVDVDVDAPADAADAGDLGLLDGGMFGGN